MNTTAEKFPQVRPSKETYERAIDVRHSMDEEISNAAKVVISTYAESETAKCHSDFVEIIDRLFAPTAGKLEILDTNFGSHIIGVKNTIGGRDESVCTTYSKHASKANAELIVRAVNSFPSLVDALKNAYFNLQVEADASIVFAVKTDSTRALLRNAISLATGETSEKVQTENEDSAKAETIRRSLS